MIDLRSKILELQGKKEPIKSFTVWWHVEDLGLFDSFEEAIRITSQDHIGHGKTIRPIPVAVSETLYEVLG